MHIWKILGIEATRDEKEIKKAYQEQLQKHHPEEDPEGFRQLREAYEAALIEAKRDVIEAELTPEESVVKQFSDLYQDFGRRLQVEEWNVILAQDICNRIDSQMEIGEKLLVFFMESYYIPQSVWICLDSFFSWSKQVSVLKEKFPANFIDFVMNNILYEETIRYEYFDIVPGKDYDEFIASCHELSRLIGTEEKEKVMEDFDKADRLDIKHRDYDLLKLRHYMLNQQVAEAASLAEVLIEQYPEDIRVKLGTAQSYLRTGRLEVALSIFEEILEENPKYYDARVGVANCHYEKEDYLKSKELFRLLLLEFPYDAYLNSAFYWSNEKLIPILEKQLQEDETNQDTICKLASCYCNCREFDECRELLRDFIPEEEYRAKYHDLYAISLIETGCKEEAVPHLLEWENLEEDRTRVANQLPWELYACDRIEEALNKCEEYLKDYPAESRLYDMKAKILRQQGKTEEALQVIEEGLSVNTRELNLYIQKAEINFDRRNYGEALDNSDKALQIYPYVYDMLLMQMKIYYYSNNPEAIIRVCDLADSYGIQDERTGVYRALADLDRSQQAEDAITLLSAYYEKEQGDLNILYALNHYYEAKGDYQEALLVLDKGIKTHKEDLSLRLTRIANYRKQGKVEEAFKECCFMEDHLPEILNADFHNEKGLIYVDMKDQFMAIASFEKAIELNEWDGRAYGNLADCHFRERKYEEAISCYTKQISNREHPYYYLSRGLAYGRMEDYDHEMADYKKAIEMDPKYAYAHNNMGVLLYDLNRPEEALPYLEEAATLEPSMLSAKRYLAKTRFLLRQFEEAMRVVDAAILYFQKQNPTGCQILYIDKLEFYKELGDYEKGLELASNVIDKTNPDLDALKMLAYCAYELRKDKQAKDYYETALKLAPQDTETLRSTGYFYLHSGQHNKGVKYYEKAVKLEPAFYANQLGLAKAYKLAGKLEEAKMHYATAMGQIQSMMKEKESTPCLCFKLAECLHGLDKTQEARDQYLIAIERADNYCHCAKGECYEAIYGLGCLAEETGNSEEADEYFNRAIAIIPCREFINAKTRLKGTNVKRKWFSFFKNKGE